MTRQTTHGTNKAPHRRGQANETRESNVSPASTIVKLCEDSVCWGVISHDPEDEQKHEEAKYVHEQQDPFSQGQLMCAEYVESDGQQEEGVHE